MGLTWAHAGEKSTVPVKPTSKKKSQNRNISPIWGEAPAEWIELKICIGDIIMEVMFKLENFRDFDVTEVKIRPLSLTLHMGLTTVQRYL